MKKKYSVGILGATGNVGQRFIQLLEQHPWFTITEVVASEKSAGKAYSEATSWKMATPIPSDISSIKIKPLYKSLDCDFVFSGLDSSIAGEAEEWYAKKGYPVISNAKNHRMDPDVPLLIADVNPSHIDIIPFQKKRRGYDTGFIVTNPNCSVIGLMIALQPLEKAFGIKQFIATTMQAISGAGYPGVASMDILDNIIPHIGEEEDKVITEPKKIFGNISPNAIIDKSLSISATCNRVAVFDGHLESVSVEFDKKNVPVEEIKRVFTNYTCSDCNELPSAPSPLIQVFEQPDRPQPRLDRNTGNGMTVSIGKVETCNVLDMKCTVLSHNTIRGAAGTAILNAELLYYNNMLLK